MGVIITMTDRISGVGLVVCFLLFVRRGIEGGKRVVLTEIEEPVRAGGKGIGFLAGFDGVDFSWIELYRTVRPNLSVVNTGKAYPGQREPARAEARNVCEESDSGSFRSGRGSRYQA